MRPPIVADECVDREIVFGLRDEGFSVLYIAEAAPSTTDPEVLEMASEAGALLLTSDKDFGEIVFRQGRLHSGVLLIRLSGLESFLKARITIQAIQDHIKELPGNFSVLEKERLRIRQSPETQGLGKPPS